MIIAANLVAGGARGSLIAIDDASQPPYATWETGDNGGTGWGGGWTINANAFGICSYPVNDSDANGSGGSPGIDTPTAAGRSWGIFARNSGPESLGDAVRPFSGSLDVGQTVLVSMDNGTLAAGSADGVVGIGLRSANVTRFEFILSGNASVYQVSDAAGFRDTTVAPTFGGIDLAFTLTGATSYSLSISRRDGGGSQALTGTLSGGALDCAARVQLSRRHLRSGQCRILQQHRHRPRAHRGPVDGLPCLRELNAPPLPAAAPAVTSGATAG